MSWPPAAVGPLGSRSGADRLTGSVATFDDARGLGTVLGGDGTEHGFHCTAIADGTRTIEVGTRVTYVLRARHRGAWEAADLRPL